MPIPQTYYLNGVNLESSTAVFLDAAMSMCAPDGYYSDGTIVRRQINCVLYSEQKCPDCCQEPCSLWNFKGLGVSGFEVTYFDCITGLETLGRYSESADEDVCVIKGTTPVLTTGDGDITLVSDCGCCTTQSCNTWTISVGLSEVGAFSYIGCDDIQYTVTLTDNNFMNVCVKYQTVPVLVNGVGAIEFLYCGC